jgi:peptidoglycan/xylan/chitin deacetylase (PgdA/CDA1 family)
MAWLSAAHGAAKRIRLGFQPRAVVLMYHRIAEGFADPFNLCVSPGHFSEQLEVLGKQYSVVRLEDLFPMLRDRKLPPKAVAITFDDGYADIQQTAAGLLERAEMPATVFVTSGYLDGRLEYWWDELSRLVLESRSDPFAWSLEEDGLPAIRPEGATRDGVVKALQEHLRAQSPDDRESLLARIAVSSGLDRIVRPTHRSMTAGECAALSAGSLVTVGAHTVHHPWLSALSGEKQEEELRQAKRVLEEITGHPVRTLAYPYGRRDSVSEKTLERARDAGYICACANERGLVKADSNPLWIPRFIPRNVDGETFAQRMRMFFQDHSAVRAPCGREP